MKRKAFTERVELWRRLLMPEWRVALFFEEPEGNIRSHHAHGQDDWVACSGSDPTIAEARLYVKPEVLTFDADQIDRIIVHELLHPLLDRVLGHAEVLRDYVPPPVFHAYEQGRIADEEELVNRIAHVISTHGEHGESPYGTHRCKA
ncbi:MAG TPA: hypothetical protein VD761_07760 [Solirubrobacterales bacterium]|nr:hypothetical protein [Solirubrobacterales bacterium]